MEAGHLASMRSRPEEPAIGGAAIFGRQQEQRDLSAVVTDPGSIFVSRLIDGSPGAGKTALLEFAVSEAQARGVPVMRTAPSEAESSLPYAGLGDLLDSVPEPVIDALPLAQRRAIRAALVRESDDAGEVEAHAVARGTLGVVRALSARGPFLLAIDDVHWLDAPTTRVLLFVLRRVADEAIRLVATRRVGEAEEWRDTLARALPDDRHSQLRLDPLTVDEVAALLDARLALRLPRPALVRLHRRSEGNPLFALELGRALRDAARHADRPPMDAEDLSDLLRARLSALAPGPRRAVLLAAAASQPTASMLEELASPSAVAEAERAEVLRHDGARVRFVHPLLASVAYSMADADELEQIHRALAQLVEDADERALHLALGTSQPSAAIAASLTEAAAHAAGRGAPEIGAQLAEHAARLTPPDSPGDRRQRSVLCADLLLAAGDPQRARAMLESVAAELGAGPQRADVLWRLADAVGDDLPRSTALSEQALEEAGDDLELKIRIRLALGTFTWLSGQLSRSADHVREAARLAEAGGNEQMLAMALGEVLHAEAVLGRSEDATIVERAMTLERRVGAFPPGTRPSFQLGIVYVYTDRLDEARPLLEAELKRVEATGDESMRVAVLFRLAELELRAGQWSRALRWATESVSLAEQAGIEQEQCVASTALATVLAHLGRMGEATQLAQKALAIAQANGDAMSVLRTRGALGFIALSERDHAAAADWLAPAMAGIEALDIGELSIYGVVQNHLDALVALDRLDEAHGVVELLERKGQPANRFWHLCVAARGRALIAAARGEEAEAIQWSTAALEGHASLPQPFERGRTLLVKGNIERRFRRRAAARATLAEALGVFDDLGAALWAETAAGELARISGRVAAGGGLTATEQRVVDLVADGLSNGEVAARLFVAVRTVEAHLSRIYAKLGIRSRVDLARRAATRSESDAP